MPLSLIKAPLLIVLLDLSTPKETQEVLIKTPRSLLTPRIFNNIVIILVASLTKSEKICLARIITKSIPDKLRISKFFDAESIKYTLVINIPMPEYVDLKLPRELVDSVRKFISENPEYGYTSAPEFIKEAIRIRLRELEAHQIKKFGKIKEMEKP